MPCVDFDPFAGPNSSKANSSQLRQTPEGPLLRRQLLRSAYQLIQFVDQGFLALRTLSACFEMVQEGSDIPSLVRFDAERHEIAIARKIQHNSTSLVMDLAEFAGDNNISGSATPQSHGPISQVL
jgi:hypothetical protein